MKDIYVKNLRNGLVVLLLAMLTCNIAFGQKKKYNVLFIAIDDLNDYISLLEGYPNLQTPNLDKFAKTALTFTHAYCAAPVCNPSRVAVLTGEKPTRTGIYENTDFFQNSPVATKATLLPELYKQNGYTTLWSGKIFHTKPSKERLKAMWDDMEGHDGGYGPLPTQNNVSDQIRRTKWFNYQEWDGPLTDFPDVVNASITIRRLQQHYDQPFFMALGLYRPHNPWIAPKKFFDMYPLESVRLPEVLENDLEDIPPMGRAWAQYPVNLEELKSIQQWKPVVRSYLASISFMDDNLGRVLDTLDNSLYRNNTIVVLWADNGFHMGEKEHFTKFGLWEKTTHVLFMIRVPGMATAGLSQQQPVNLLDIYPTLVDLCNLSEPVQSLDGISLVPMIDKEHTERKEPSITYYKHGSVGIRTSDWRYIRYHDGTEELYDENNDPKEFNNLANDPAYEKIKQELSIWIPTDTTVQAGSNP